MDTAVSSGDGTGEVDGAEDQQAGWWREGVHERAVATATGSRARTEAAMADNGAVPWRAER